MLGKLIENLRKAKRISQTELASMCKLNRVAIWKIETGRVEPRFNTLKSIASALGVEAGIFFDETITNSQRDFKNEETA